MLNFGGGRCHSHFTSHIYKAIWKEGVFNPTKTKRKPPHYSLDGMIDPPSTIPPKDIQAGESAKDGTNPGEVDLHLIISTKLYYFTNLKGDFPSSASKIMVRSCEVANKFDEIVIPHFENFKKF